ncbi:MAG: SURF1 family protein, partial [Gammaproteobacteria bacterium]
IRIGRQIFRFPGLLPNLLTVALLSLLLGLGFWQLDRARQKDALAKDFVATPGQRSFDSIASGGSYTRFQKAVAVGRFVDEPAFLLDNRAWKGRPGYQVLIPFRLRQGQGLVLVNLGWVPRGRTRQDLPDLVWPRESRDIDVLVTPPPEKVIRLGPDDPPVSSRARVIQAIETGLLSGYLNEPLLPYVLLLEESETFGYERAWKPYYGITSDKHRGYAFQWFSLAATLLILYVMVNTRRTDQGAREGRK